MKKTLNCAVSQRLFTFAFFCLVSFTACDKAEKILDLHGRDILSEFFTKLYLKPVIC